MESYGKQLIENIKKLWRWKRFLMLFIMPQMLKERLEKLCFCRN